MADASPNSSCTAIVSPRAKKRQRQKNNQQKREYAHDALIAFTQNTSFGNAFRAWLAHLDETMPSNEYRSAYKFTRALRNFSSKSSGEPDYPETARISAETLASWVDSLAWSLNVKFTINENAASIKTPTARVGSNFRSLITFLAQAHAISEADFSYLIDECKSLEDDLGRTARVNRIMEEYAVYIQEAYFDTGRTVDETYYGEYEVERFEGRRILVLRRYDPDDDSDTSSASLRPFTTYFPAPLVANVRRGDTLTLQICHLEHYNVWVPYMYSGFTPTREDGGAATPTEREVRASSRSGYDATSVMETAMRRLNISPERRSTRRSPTPRRVGPEHHHQAPSTPGFDFTFDESKYTDDFFRAWDGDIDTDEDFTDLVRSPDEETERSGGSDTPEGGVNLYHTLRERHSMS